MIPQKIISKIVIVAIVFVSGAFAGYSYRSSLNYKGVIKQQKKDAKEVLEHTEKFEVVKKNVSEKIKVIKKITDPTGCLDTNSPDNYLDGLLNIEHGKKSGLN